MLRCNVADLEAIKWGFMFQTIIKHIWVKKCRMMALASVIIVALAGCQNAHDTAMSEAQLAMQLYEAQDYSEAAKHARAAIAARDDIIDFYLLKAQIDLANGQTRSAYLAAREGLALDRGNQQALVLVTNLGLQLGQTKVANEAADQLLLLDTGAIPALQVKGMIALFQQKTDEALRYADKILAISPTDEGGVLLRARALAIQGKPEDAAALINKAILVNGETIGFLTSLLDIYRYDHDTQKIGEIFPQLIARVPNNMDMKLGYANFLYKTDKGEEAHALLMDIMTQRLPVEIYEKVVALWNEYDDAPHNDAALARLAKEAGSSALQSLMRHYLLTGHAAAAMKLANVVPPPKRRALQAMIGRALEASGRMDDAGKIAQAVLARDTDNVDALLLSAEIALERSKSDTALTQAQIAVRNDPLNPATYITLARVLRSAGSEVRARSVMEEGLQSLPQSHYLLTEYTEFLGSIGNESRAVSVARAFTLASPASLKGWVRYAAMCRKYSAGCRDEAEAGRTKALTEYIIDDPPGTRPNYGLFGRL